MLTPAPAPGAAALSLGQAVGSPSVVISQLYGGGGNAGSTYKNDFIELYNGGSTTVSLSGWSVQYASATGSSWQVTNLSGTLAPGRYYLVQESAGAGGTTDLPTPDASGPITMSATAGKVALVNSTTALSGTGCPTSAAIVDFVGFGTTANCFEGSAPTPAPSNTAAVLRANGGRQDTDQNATDFTAGAPAPRNSSTTPLPPLTALQLSISPAASAVQIGTTVNYTASATKAGAPVPITSASWSSSNPAVATIDATTGVATTVGGGTTTIGVTATTAQGSISTTTTLTASAAVATVTVSPLTWSLKTSQTKLFTASAQDANGNAVTTGYSWTSSNPAVATIDAATGLATGKTVGTATLTAKAQNNVAGTATITVTAGNISVQGRTDPLPVGFQTQIFLNNGSTDAAGTAVGNADVVWSSRNTALVTVDPATGVITAKGAGSTVITATAKSDGVSAGSTTIVTDVEPVSPNARVGHNTELGIPTDANPSDDVIIARRQYTLSYNVSHGGPNWVSWNLDVTHKGSASRCNCFTADTALTRLGIEAYDTSDWINGGIYSRGHMSPSADWAAASGDNAPTFFLSNMIPQNQTANAGAWGDLENYLRTLAVGTTEVYIVAGPIFTKGRTGGQDGLGFMTGTGHIAVPDSMWKVAIVVPDARPASGITGPADVTVIAANMANAAVSTGSWSNYQTTIDKIQKSTGYNLLSALPERVQCRLESRNCPPTAVITGAGTAGGSEGQTLSFSGATSSDVDAADVLSYRWDIGGQVVGTATTLSYTFADNGTYQLRLIVSDNKGSADTTTVSVVVLNVAPIVSAFAGATLLPGETYGASGSFTDPGADTWTATVDFGDGSGVHALALANKSFQLSHTYISAGSYTVTVRVLDKDGGVGTRSATVVVQTVLQGISNLGSLVAGLDGTLNKGEVNSLQAKLNAASARQRQGDSNAVSGMLGAFVNEVNAMVKSGRVTAASAAPLLDYARRLLQSLQS